MQTTEKPKSEKAVMKTIKFTITKKHWEKSEYVIHHYYSTCCAWMNVERMAETALSSMMNSMKGPRCCFRRVEARQQFQEWLESPRGKRHPGGKGESRVTLKTISFPLRREDHEKLQYLVKHGYVGQLVSDHDRFARFSFDRFLLKLIPIVDSLVCSDESKSVDSDNVLLGSWERFKAPENIKP